MSHQGYPKDPSGQGGGEWNSVRDQVGPPSLRRQGGHLNRASPFVTPPLMQPSEPSCPLQTGNLDLPVFLLSPPASHPW